LRHTELTCGENMMSESNPLRYLRPDQLVPTKDNPRVLREDQAFKELVKSVQGMGILQPLIARPMPSGPEDEFDLRAGHRRLAAAKKAGLETVPVVVRDMDDKTAMEVTVSENLQRENLHPLEESRAIQHLMDVGWDAKAIADRLGKSVGWLAKRAKLGDLSEAWKKAIEDPKHGVSLWPASLLEQIARLSSETQDAVLAELRDEARLPWGHGYGEQKGVLPTSRELDRWLAAEFLHPLAGAPWDMSDHSLSPKDGACTVCMRRSSCQPMLFEGMETAVAKGKKSVSQDRCLDLACYHRKLDAFCRRKYDELKAENGEVIALSEEYLSPADEAALRKVFPNLTTDHHNTAKANEKGAKPAVIVMGPRSGQTLWVKPPSRTGTGGSSKREAGKPLTLKERRERLQQRRAAHVLEAIRRLLEDPPEAFVPKQLFESAACIRLAMAFGTNHRFDCGWEAGPWQTWKNSADWKPREAAADLLLHIMPVLRGRLSFHDGAEAARQLPEAVRVCKLLEIDLAGLEKAAADEIPEPKAWASLKPDGTPAKPAQTKPKAKGLAKKTKKRAR